MNSVYSIHVSYYWDGVISLSTLTVYTDSYAHAQLIFARNLFNLDDEG